MGSSASAFFVHCGARDATHNSTQHKTKTPKKKLKKEDRQEVQRTSLRVTHRESYRTLPDAEDRARGSDEGSVLPHIKYSKTDWGTWALHEFSDAPPPWLIY